MSDESRIVPDGAARIVAERERQMSEEGYHADHDDQHTQGELAAAAISYLERAGAPVNGETVPASWPWWAKGWKPTGDHVGDLVKAGALIAAEIDRVLRSRDPLARREGENRAQHRARLRGKGSTAVLMGDHVGRTTKASSTLKGR